MGEVEIAHSFREAYDFDVRSSETYMVKFKALGQKKTMPTIRPPVVASPPISQVPPQTINPIMELVEAIMGVDLNSSEVPLLDKHKGKKLTVGTSKRSKKRQGR